MILRYTMSNRKGEIYELPDEDGRWIKHEDAVRSFAAVKKAVDLLFEHGSFYNSAIEIDTYGYDCPGGEGIAYMLRRAMKDLEELS